MSYAHNYPVSRRTLLLIYPINSKCPDSYDGRAVLRTLCQLDTVVGLESLGSRRSRRPRTPDESDVVHGRGRPRAVPTGPTGTASPSRLYGV